MGPGNVLEGGNREVAETEMGWGRSQAFHTLFLPEIRLCQPQVPKSYGMGATASRFPTHSSPSGNPLCQALYSFSRNQDRKTVSRPFWGGPEGRYHLLYKITWEAGHALETLGAAWVAWLQGPETSGAKLAKSSSISGFSARHPRQVTRPLCALVSPPVRWSGIVWMRAVGSID